MIRKYHNHPLQTNPRHRQGVPQKVSRRQLNYINRLFDCKTRNDTKYCTAKKEQHRTSTMGVLMANSYISNVVALSKTYYPGCFNFSIKNIVEKSRDLARAR